MTSRCITFADVFGAGATLDSLSQCTRKTVRAMTQYLLKRELQPLKTGSPKCEILIQPFQIDPVWSGVESVKRLTAALDDVLAEVDTYAPAVFVRRFYLRPLFRNFVLVHICTRAS